MRLQHLFVAVLAVTALAQAQPLSPLQIEAQRAFREQRWAAAYGRFARLADQGDARSAQAALLMLDQGPALFGSAWSASDAQRRRWLRLAARAMPPSGPATDAD